MTDLEEKRLQKIKQWLVQFSYPGEFRGFQTKKLGSGVGRTFYDFEDVKKWLLDKDYNCWYSVANTVTTKRTKKDMGHIKHIWSDMDHMTVSEAKKRVDKAGLPPPTIWVNSGHGAQALWKLEEWLNLQNEEDAAQLERALRTIASLIGGDTNAIKLTQVLRIPWTHNPKDPPADATLEEQNENAYPIETFDIGTGIEALKWVWTHKPAIDEDFGIPGLYELTFTTFAGYAYHHDVKFEDAKSILEQLIAARDDAGLQTEGPTLLTALENTYKAGKGGEKVNYTGLQGKRYEAIVVAALGELWSMKASLEEGALKLGSNRWIVNKEDGIKTLWYQKETLFYDDVTTKGMSLLNHYLVDGEHYWEVVGFSGVFSRKGILDEFEKQGYIVGHRYISDSISKILSNGPEATPGHATVGVYVKDGKLEFCHTPLPVKPLQKRTHLEIIGAIDRKPTKEELQAYVDFLRHWKDYEVLPTLGLSFIAPFAFGLRSRGKLVPHILLVCSQTDVGKTLTAGAFTEKLYLIDSISGDLINSVFRLLSYYDSICGPRAVNEATLKAELEDLLKEGAESKIVSGRGKMSGEIPISNSRQCFIITSNEDILSHKTPVAKRFVIILFDPTEKVLMPTKDRRLIAREADNLQPIGWGCAQLVAEKLETEEELLSRIDTWEKEIITLHDTWRSPKRAEIWAILYQGVQHFIMMCKEQGVDFDYSIEDWVKEVITPVEEEMQEGARSEVEYYFDARLRWRNRNTTRGGILGEDGVFNAPPTIKGEGELWVSKPLELDRESVQGEWHTSAMMGEIEEFVPQGHKTFKMKDLARQVLRYLKLPESKIDSVYKARRMGVKVSKAVFIPIE